MARAGDPLSVHARLAGVLVASALAGACGDAAHQAYLGALRGEESGMTVEQQIALLDRAIALAPARAEYLETRAGRWIGLQDFERALGDLDAAIAMADRPYLRYSRALVICERGQPAAALADFDRAIAGQPANQQFYRGRALARAATGDGPGALADADHAVTLQSNDARAYYARGIALYTLGRDQDAVGAFSRASDLRPELVYPLNARANAFQRLGQHERARSDRAAAQRSAETHAGCAVCLDPFRY